MSLQIISWANSGGGALPHISGGPSWPAHPHSEGFRKKNFSLEKKILRLNLCPTFGPHSEYQSCATFRNRVKSSMKVARGKDTTIHCTETPIETKQTKLLKNLFISIKPWIIQ